MASPDHRIQQIARRQHSVFTRAQALDAGFTGRMINGRLALGLWGSMHRGVYVISAARRTWRARVMAACLATNGVAVVRTAAAIWRIPGGQRAPMEVAVGADRSRTRSGVVVHRWRNLQPGDVVTVEDLPVTNPARTILDLAGALNEERLNDAVVDVLARDLTTLDRLWVRIDREQHHGRAGIATLRRVLEAQDAVVAATRSHLEPRFLRLFRKLGLPEPVPRAEIRLSTGEIVRPDFVYPDARVAIEVNSRRRHAGRARTEADLRRENQLTLDGHHLVHFTAGDLVRPGYVRGTLLTALSLGSRRSSKD